MNRKILMSAFLAFLFLVVPIIQGGADGLLIRTVFFGSSTTALNTRVFEADLSGSTAHSLAWDVSAPVSIQVHMIYVNAAGTKTAIAPTDLGFSQANPNAATGSDVIPLALPVAQKIRFTVTGVANGVLIFSDS